MPWPEGLIVWMALIIGCAGGFTAGFMLAAWLAS